MRPNYAARPRMVDTADYAREMRETFTKKKVSEETVLPFSWPAKMQHIGDSVGVAYASDKWKKNGSLELYKHIAESRNRAFAVPRFLCAFDDENEPWPTIGPMVSFLEVTMPKHIAFLGLFEEANLILHTAGTSDAPLFGPKKDHGVVAVTLQHGLLGAGQLVEPGGTRRPFLVVYEYSERQRSGGVKLLIVGDELDVEADGIVG